MFLKLNWSVFDLLLDYGFDVCWMFVYGSQIWRIYCWIFYGWLSRCFDNSVIAVWLNMCLCCGPCWCLNWCRCGHFVLMMIANYVARYYTFFGITKNIDLIFMVSQKCCILFSWCHQFIVDTDDAIDVYCSSRRAAVESCRMLHVGVTNL